MHLDRLCSCFRMVVARSTKVTTLTTVKCKYTNCCTVYAESTARCSPRYALKTIVDYWKLYRLCKAVLQWVTHRRKTRDVIDAHAIMSIQNGNLPPRADAQPVGKILCGMEGEGMEQQQGQGKVIYKVALLGELDICLILLVDLTQQPAAITTHLHMVRSNPAALA